MARTTREHPGGMLDKPVRLLTCIAALLCVGWISLVATLKIHELLVGLVVVALSTCFFILVLHSSTLPLELTLRDVMRIRSVPWAVVKDSGMLVAVLFRDVLGTRAESLYRVCGFRVSRHDPIVVGRTALAVVYTTMSPNMIVIGVDDSQSRMLFHQLRRDEVSAMTRALGAER